MLTYLKKFQKNPLILEFMISAWVRTTEELTSLTVIIQKLSVWRVAKNVLRSTLY